MDEAAKVLVERLRGGIRTAQRQLGIRGAVLRLKQSPAWEPFKQSLLSAQMARFRQTMDATLDDGRRRELGAEARILEMIATMPDRAQAEIVGLKAQITQSEEELRQMEANTAGREVQYG